MVGMKTWLQKLPHFSLRKQNIIRNPHQLSICVLQAIGQHAILFKAGILMTKRKKGSSFPQVPGDLHHWIKGFPQQYFLKHFSNKVSLFLSNISYQLKHILCLLLSEYSTSVLGAFIIPSIQNLEFTVSNCIHVVIKGNH